MATYKITFASLLNDYAVVETLTPTDVAVGQAITVSSVSATFDGAQTVYAIPQYLYIGTDSDGDLLYDFNYPVANQVLFYLDADDVTRYAVIPQGSLDYTQTCSWIDGPAVATWLGIVLADADETAFLTQCANAANNFIYLRRQESSYTDSLTTSPGTQVTLATTMYAGALYRQRGSVDQFASFDGMGNVPTTGLSPIIKQLAGIPRPAVA
jgi:hypothetical protein